MEIAIDVVVSGCVMTLDELNHLQAGQIKKIGDCVQSEVQLKSQGELIASGTLIKVEGSYCVSIDQVNAVPRG